MTDAAITIAQNNENQDNSNNSSSLPPSTCLSRRKKLHVIAISTILVIPIIILFVVMSIKKKKQNETEEEIEIEEEELILPHIIHHKNELIIYKEYINRITSITFYNNTVINLNTSFNATYLLNVYDIQNNLYYAHVSLIELVKQGKNNENILIGGNDIRENNSININSDDFPIITFQFDNYSNIYNLSNSELINTTLYAYLNEVLEKIIPKFNNNLNNKNNNFKSKIYYKEENNINLYNEKNDSFNPNSYDYKSYNISINENKIIDKVIGYSISYLKTNLTNQIEFQSNSNFSEFDEETSIKKSKIPLIFQTFESEMNIELYTIDENITNEISEKIKNIKFKDIETEKSEISQKKFSPFQGKLSSKNQLRLLFDTNVLDPFYQPIFLPFPIIRVNELENPMAIISKFSFTPLNSLFGLDVYLNISNYSFLLFNKESFTNFEDIIVLIDDVLNRMGGSIEEEIEKKADNIYKNVRIYLENQLNNMSLFIDYFPEIKDFFLSPLDTLFTSTKNASGISFNALYLDGKNINETLTNLYNDIKNNENNITLEISEITKTEIDNFIFDIQNKIDSIKNLLKIFSLKLLKILNIN